MENENLEIKKSGIEPVFFYEFLSSKFYSFCGFGTALLFTHISGQGFDWVPLLDQPDLQRHLPRQTMGGTG